MIVVEGRGGFRGCFGGCARGVHVGRDAGSDAHPAHAGSLSAPLLREPWLRHAILSVTSQGGAMCHETLFHLCVPVGDKIIRTVAVYALIVIGLRLAGKRELA